MRLVNIWFNLLKFLIKVLVDIAKKKGFFQLESSNILLTFYPLRGNNHLRIPESFCSLYLKLIKIQF